MQAVVLASADEVLPLSEALLRRGVLGRPLPYASALAFSPPLVVTDAEVDELASATADAMAEVVAARA
jgi:L-2,4-diaminobutyrate transaminase